MTREILLYEVGIMVKKIRVSTKKNIDKKKKKVSKMVRSQIFFDSRLAIDPN